VYFLSVEEIFEKLKKKLKTVRNVRHGSSEPWIANTDVLNTQGREATRAKLIYKIKKKRKFSVSQM